MGGGASKATNSATSHRGNSSRSEENIEIARLKKQVEDLKHELEIAKLYKHGTDSASAQGEQSSLSIAPNTHDGNILDGAKESSRRSATQTKDDHIHLSVARDVHAEHE